MSYGINMSYCAFQNTRAAIDQCIEIAQEHQSFSKLLDSATHNTERNAMREFAEHLMQAAEFFEELELNDLDEDYEQEED